MDHQQQQQQQQQNDGGQHPVISDLCFHLSKSSKAVNAKAEAAIKDGASSHTLSKSNNDHPLSSPSSSSSSSTSANKRSSIPLPVAAIRVLLNVIRRSEAETMMGLQVCV